MLLVMMMHGSACGLWIEWVVWRWRRLCCSRRRRAPRRSKQERTPAVVDPGLEENRGRGFFVGSRVKGRRGNWGVRGFVVCWRGVSEFFWGFFEGFFRLFFFRDGGRVPADGTTRLSFLFARARAFRTASCSPSSSSSSAAVPQTRHPHSHADTNQAPPTPARLALPSSSEPRERVFFFWLSIAYEGYLHKNKNKTGVINTRRRCPLPRDRGELVMRERGSARACGFFGALAGFGGGQRHPIDLKPSSRPR